MVEASKRSQALPERYRQHFVDQAYEPCTDDNHAVGAEVLARNPTLRGTHKT